MLFKLGLVVLLFAGLAMATPAKVGKRSDGEVLSRDDFKDVIESFVEAASHGAEGLGKVEKMAYSALVTGGDEEEWSHVGDEFEVELTTVLSQILPDIIEIGEMTEKLFDETEDFEQEPGCDNFPRYIADEAEAYKYENYEVGLAISFMEDIGCFRDRFGRARHIDPNEIDENFSARDALEMSYRILEGAQDIIKSLQTWEALGAKKKKSVNAGGDKMDRLIRLLKEMKLDTRRRRK